MMTTTHLTYGCHVDGGVERASFSTPSKIRPLNAIARGFSTVYSAGNTFSWVLFSIVGIFTTILLPVSLDRLLPTGKEGIWSVSWWGLVGIAMFALSTYASAGLVKGISRGISGEAPRVKDIFTPRIKSWLRVVTITLILFAIFTWALAPVFSLFFSAFVTGMIPSQALFYAFIAVAVVVILVVGIFTLFSTYIAVDADSKIFSSFVLGARIAGHNFFRVLALLLLTSLILIIPAVISTVFISLVAPDAYTDLATTAMIVFTAVLLIPVYAPFYAIFIIAYRQALTHEDQDRVSHTNTDDVEQDDVEQEDEEVVVDEEKETKLPEKVRVDDKKDEDEGLTDMQKRIRDLSSRPSE